MASQTCWRCLLRPVAPPNGLSSGTQRVAFAATTSSSFSTSLPRAGFRLKKKPIKKKEGKTPAPGERKALRKMIVLSNTNALIVPNLQEMTAENVSDPECRSTVFSLPDKIVSRLRATEAFQTKQRWKMFRQPSIVLRSVDVRLAQMMDDARESKRVVKQVLVGERGAGKSLYLLQATASAMLKDWIVITIPDAHELVNASTDYGPIPNSSPTVYAQKTYTAALLQRIMNANPQLADIKMSMKHQLSVSIPSGLSLTQLAQLGAHDPVIAQSILEALFKELTLEGRPPLLITLDGMNHINSDTAYKSSVFKPIHAHDLYLPAWFLAHLSGKLTLPNGGAVLAAMTRSNAPHVQTLDDRLEHLEKQQAVLAGSLEINPEDSIILPYLKATGQEHLASQIPELDPFVRYDPRVLEVFNKNNNANNDKHSTSPTPSSVTADIKSNSDPVNADLPPSTSVAVTPTNSSWSSMTPGDCEIEIKRFNGLTKREAKSLMEYWALSGILRAEISERFVGEQWSVAGGGLPGELERTCLGMRY